MSQQSDSRPETYGVCDAGDIANVPDDVVYNLVKATFDISTSSRSATRPSCARPGQEGEGRLSAPLHPGRPKFYRKRAGSIDPLTYGAGAIPRPFARGA